MQEINSIKTIIFDLGGVVVDINPDWTVKELERLGVDLPDNQVNKYSNFGLFNDYEKGHINEAQFLAELQKMSSNNVEIQSLKDAWNGTIRQFPQEGLELIQKISKKYQLILLSNTNESHISYSESLLPNGACYKDYFHNIYYSYKMGISKPDPEIYRTILLESNIKANEVLLIDDSKANIDAARDLGLQTYWEKGHQTWIELFND